MRGVDELTEVLEALAADADEALRYEQLAEERRERIRENLVKARKMGAGPAELERTIKSIYVSRTISRWTKDAEPAGTPRRPRKRPGAAPSGS